MKLRIEWLKFRWQYSLTRHIINTTLRRVGFKIYGDFSGTARPNYSYTQYLKYRGVLGPRGGKRKR